MTYEKIAKLIQMILCLGALILVVYGFYFYLDNKTFNTYGLAIICTFITFVLSVISIREFIDEFKEY